MGMKKGGSVHQDAIRARVGSVVRDADGIAPAPPAVDEGNQAPSRGRGRPPKGRKRRDVQLHIRVSEDDRIRIEEAAERVALDLSAWCRQAIMEKVGQG